MYISLTTFSPRLNGYLVWAFAGVTGSGWDKRASIIGDHVIAYDICGS